MRYPTLLVFACLLANAALGAADDWKPLWNGRDFSGWEKWLGKPSPALKVEGLTRDADGKYTEPLGVDRDPTGVFTVVNADGQTAIRVSGQIFGAITTKETYGNYHLRLQFKWGVLKWPPRDQAVRDSGLLYHVHGPMNFNGKVWPRSPEVQIQEHDVGDLYAIGCQMTVLARRLDPTKRLFQYDVHGAPTDFIEQLPIGNRCIRLEDRENPMGEWNTVELICLGDQSIHIVNGGVVMRLTKARRLDGSEPAPLSAGQILLQSEGAEIYFRNIELRPITAIPAEYAER